ncbi:MAG: DUF2127 domain-containing protein [Acidobacteriaceae bacterium]
MDVSLGAERHAEEHHDKWLVLIGVLKVLKGLGLVLLGVGALRLLHRDLVSFLNHWIVVVLRFDPESHMVNFILTKAALVNTRELRMLSLGIFVYASLELIEGTGLVLEKVWAEYVTLVFTAAFLPWEFYELLLHFSLFKVGLVTANLLIVLYLLWLVQAQARRRVQRFVHRKSRH